MTTNLNAGWTELDRPRSSRPPQRRQTTAQRQAAELAAIEAAEAKEQARLESRAIVNRKIEQAKLVELRLVELDEATDQSNDSKDALASQHCDRVGPLQEELAAMEAEAIDRLVTGEDSEEDQRRSDLRQQIRDLTASFEKQLAEIDSNISLLQRERFEVSQSMRGECASTLRSSLIKTGKPELLLRLKAFESAVRWARSRFDAASAKAREFPAVAWLAIEVEESGKALCEAERLRTALVETIVAE